MATSEPRDSQTLYPTYFGDIIANNAGKEGAYTQTLYPTYFGEIIGGNDWITQVATTLVIKVCMVI